MIKAISRQVLEVVDTGNAYFDKAWLMVAPELTSADRSTLEAEAAEYICSLDPPGAFKQRRRLLPKALRYLFSAAAGGLVTALIIQLY